MNEVTLLSVHEWGTPQTEHTIYSRVEMNIYNYSKPINISSFIAQIWNVKSVLN